MRDSFLAWAKKKKLLDENNKEVSDHMVQWLWIGWQTAWKAGAASHKPAMDKLRMERDAYSSELDKILQQKAYLEALSEPEEKL
jgi:hypothetical protein